MKHAFRALLFAPALLYLPMESYAQPLKYQLGEVEFKANLQASIQDGELFDATPPDGSTQEIKLDASARLDTKWITDNGSIFGFRIEYDTGNHTAEDLQRDELYAYFSNQFGRIEIGEQDGPADVLAYHAPLIGLGQIRGEFARYDGKLALLSPLDTSDDLKAVYFSPPANGMRFGFSWAPTYERNTEKPDPTDHTIQNDAMEFGVQYQKPISNWIAGLSGSYVTASSKPSTEREDINSWSIGTQWRHSKFIFGAAYVVRGDSNRKTKGFGQDEFNGGITWRDKHFGVALSASKTESSSSKNKLTGIGAYYEINRWLMFSADAVHFIEKRSSSRNEGYVLVAELKLRL